jgi:hypothetical protein
VEILQGAIGFKNAVTNLENLLNLSVLGPIKMRARGNSPPPPASLSPAFIQLYQYSWKCISEFQDVNHENLRTKVIKIPSKQYSMRNCFQRQHNTCVGFKGVFCMVNISFQIHRISDSQSTDGESRNLKYYITFPCLP